jgi:hypothetical protein
MITEKMEIKMENIDQFNAMCDWELKAGSHDFPGPHGGTCINEAAIIAAGFKYKKVSSWMDCPPCFSPLVSQYAIVLNDHLNDIDRQKLMPFVTKIAGTKGSNELEEARALWFVRQIVNDDLFTIAKLKGCLDLASLCLNAKTKQELKYAVDEFRSSSLLSSLSLLSLSSSLSLSLSSLSLSSGSKKAIARLEGLIKFGRSELPEIEIDLAKTNLSKAKELATT